MPLNRAKYGAFLQKQEEEVLTALFYLQTCKLLDLPHVDYSLKIEHCHSVTQLTILC